MKSASGSAGRNSSYRMKFVNDSSGVMSLSTLGAQASLPACRYADKRQAQMPALPGSPVASRKKVPESPFVASRKKVPETNHCKTAIRSIRFHPVGEAEAGSAGEQPTKE